MAVVAHFVTGFSHLLVVFDTSIDVLVTEGNANVHGGDFVSLHVTEFIADIFVHEFHRLRVRGHRQLVRDLVRKFRVRARVRVLIFERPLVHRKAGRLATLGHVLIDRVVRDVEPLLHEVCPPHQRESKIFFGAQAKVCGRKRTQRKRGAAQCREGEAQTKTKHEFVYENISTPTTKFRITTGTRTVPGTRSVHVHVAYEYLCPVPHTIALYNTFLHHAKVKVGKSSSWNLSLSDLKYYVIILLFCSVWYHTQYSNATVAICPAGSSRS